MRLHQPHCGHGWLLWNGKRFTVRGNTLTWEVWKSRICFLGVEEGWQSSNKKLFFYRSQGKLTSHNNTCSALSNLALSHQKALLSGMGRKNETALGRSCLVTLILQTYISISSMTGKLSCSKWAQCLFCYSAPWTGSSQLIAISLHFYLKKYSATSFLSLIIVPWICTCSGFLNGWGNDWCEREKKYVIFNARCQTVQGCHCNTVTLDWFQICQGKHSALSSACCFACC